MNIIKEHYKKVWWLVILILTSLYFRNNYIRITLNPTVIDIVIVGCWIIVIFMPLISEISLMGFTVKKEIESVKNELRKEVLGIKYDIVSLASIHSNNNNSIYFSNERIPMESEVKSIIDNKTTNHGDSIKIKPEGENIVEDFPDISDNNIYLFKVRLTLEKKIIDLMKIYAISESSNIKTNITLLRHCGAINMITEDKLLKVLSICNRGVHGEVIDNEYISYVKVVLDEFKKEIVDFNYKAKQDMESFVVCDRCGYTGASFYNNQCPCCKHISDNY